MKRIFTIALCVCLIITGTITASASSSTNTNPNANFNSNFNNGKAALDKARKEHPVKVEKDLGVLDGLGFDENKILDVTVSQNSRITYAYQETADIVGDITIYDVSSGIALGVTEGSIHNDIVIDDVGNLYIDGNMVTYSSEKTTPTSDGLRTNGDVLKTTLSSSQYSNTPGSWAYVGPDNSPNVSMATPWILITLTAFSIACSALPGFALVGYSFDLISSFVQPFYSLGQQINPNGKFFSCKIQVYRSSGSTNGNDYHFYGGQYFTGVNYTGSVKSINVYAHTFVG